MNENAKDGAILPWGTVREQFLDAVTLEVAGNVAPSFSGPCGWEESSTFYQNRGLSLFFPLWFIIGY